MDLIGIFIIILAISTLKETFNVYGKKRDI